jgi:hypothetical protein
MHKCAFELSQCYIDMLVVSGLYLIHTDGIW